MSTAKTGLLAGLLLAVAGAAGGFGGFLLALVLGFVGVLVGAQLDGEVDIAEMVRGRGRG